ncbi:ATP-dependent DNA helicase [Jonesia quinghaiensis]|uniref:ATP-dependent DNA helicase n=1 Tax=Jonesia quinghaiensis TaxID=262806 RepID=UPI0004173746|nr:ATP-dependent DNA helicase [Jonesia quinghaiensis]
MTQPPTPTLSAHDISQLLNQPPPTPEQAAIIESPLESLLVIAGAGSGKTETMSARVVWLIANGLVEPQKILGLTFTRKAAGELAERIRTRLTQLAHATGRENTHALDVLDRPTISTYNSYAASIVTEHGLRIGREPGARLLSEASSWAMASAIVERWHSDLDTENAVTTITEAVLQLAGETAEHLLTIDEARAALDHLIEPLQDLPVRGRAMKSDVLKLGRTLALRRQILDLVEEYHTTKRRTDSMDFSDQVALAAQLAMTHPIVGAGERERFSVVLLDEYQDTSYAQIQLLKALFGREHPVTAVGDPNQSIYGWRGASASGLARFPTDFPTTGGRRAAIANLTTSWRNDVAILDAANVTAAPLAHDSVIDISPLQPRPGAGHGTVTVGYSLTAHDEADAIAQYLKEHFVPGATTAAVLCRARKQFALLEERLRAAGLPVEVVGLGGLLNTPEIVDIVSLLEVVHDPSRGDSLMRLLTGPRFHLGAMDLYTLGVYARHLARNAGRNNAHGATEAAEERSIIDALAQLPAASWTASSGESFSAAGHARLVSLSQLIDQLRRQTYLPLPDLVDTVERALGLDVEVALKARQQRSQHGAIDPIDPWGRAHLDAFRSVVSDFAAHAVHPTLGAVLAWLHDARVRERGLDRPTGHSNPHAVQLITVHASKGLEWDIVAVPGLSDGVFPSTAATKESGPRDSGWISSLGTLPFSMRGDARDLPELDISAADDDADLLALIDDFKSRCGEYQVAEERRLAYVAFTRARAALFVSGAWWRSGKNPQPPSPFLTELLNHTGVAHADVVTDPGTENPAPQESETALWPLQAVDDIVARSAELVAHHSQVLAAHSADSEERDSKPLISAEGIDLTSLAELLEAEQQQRTGDSPTFPDHLSVSALVELSADASAYLMQYRRPVPRRPSIQSRRGTTFHLWVEQFYGTTALFDMEDLSEFDAEASEEDLSLDALQATFEASMWATRTPRELEANIDVVLAGTVVRARIDAVFDDPATGGVVVVDWKTGRAPQDATQRRHREVQLAVYRLAWATWSGMPLEKVSAAFYYVAEDLTVTPEVLMSKEDIEGLIRSAAGGPISG